MVKVTVVGGGSLGIKIIGELAFHGHEVRVYDRSSEALDRVRLRIQEEKRLLAEDGLLMTANFLGDIYFISRLEEAVKSADFIFEAVPEDLALKQDLFEWISQCCKSDCVIASNSMNLSIDDIANRSSHKERCLVIRFLYPVYCIPEVELVLGSSTSLAALEKVRVFLARMGKVPFFRSGKDPLVLSLEEREAKKMRNCCKGQCYGHAVPYFVHTINTFMKFIQENKGNLQKLKRNIPNLSDKQILAKAIDLDLDESPSREKDCVVCMDEERNCVLHPCHHMCTCTTCGRLLLKRQDSCPICRKHISSIFRVFHS